MSSVFAYLSVYIVRRRLFFLKGSFSRNLKKKKTFLKKKIMDRALFEKWARFYG